MRDFIRTFLFAALSCICLMAGDIFPRISLDGASFGNAEQEFMVSIARGNSALRQKCLSALTDGTSAEAYVKSVREKLRKAFILPSERTPLNASVTSEFHGMGYVARNVIYYSRPGYPVTATLFLPDRGGRHPAVLFAVGHSTTGRKSSAYLRCCVQLARMGFSVLSVDPISQGERLQFTDIKQPIPLTCSGEHNMRGKQLLLIGENLASWRVWDLIRGIDYLESVPEVDMSRLAITGNSGGGTMACFVGMLDERVKVIAPSCSMTRWQRNIENELPIDAEQILPGVLRDGLEMADLLIARAPNPVLIMGQEKDFFDVRGTRESFEDIRRIYALLGKRENAALFVGPTTHSYSVENRTAMYNFLNEKILGGKNTIVEDESIPLPDPSQLVCAPGGQVVKINGAKSLHAMICERIPTLQKHSVESLRKELCENLQIQSLDVVPEYRILRVTSVGDQTHYLSRFALETEKKHVMAILFYWGQGGFFHIPKSKEAVLYVANLSAASELPDVSTKTTMPLWGVDIRGIGAMAPSGATQIERTFFAPYQVDYHYDSIGIMCGVSRFGGKVRDILGAVALLKSAGIENVHLRARGLGSVPALVAAFLLQEHLASVELVDAPYSWRNMVQKEYTLWPQAIMPDGILKITDLPALRDATPNLQASFSDEPFSTEP